MNIEHATSIAQRNAGTNMFRLVRIHHQSSAPNNTAGIFNAKMSGICAAPNAARPDTELGGDTIAQDLINIHAAIAMPSAADTHRK
jgi:hypothetical protein